MPTVTNVRIYNQQLYALLVAEAAREGRSATKQLERILSLHYRHVKEVK